MNGIRPEDTVVVTTAAFRRGQAAARVDFKRDPDATPLIDLLERMDPEFGAGYRDEWFNYLAPTRRAELAREARDLEDARKRCEAARWPEQHRDDCAWCAHIRDQR